jgi:hypothetical protein
VADKLAIYGLSVLLGVWVTVRLVYSITDGQEVQLPQLSAASSYDSIG